MKKFGRIDEKASNEAEGKKYTYDELSTKLKNYRRKYGKPNDNIGDSEATNLLSSHLESK